MRTPSGPDRAASDEAPARRTRQPARAGDPEPQHAAAILPEEGPDPGEHVVKVVGLIVATAFVSALHYGTDPSYAVLHGLYQRLHYVPIIVAAYWYGVRGGLLLAAGTALTYIPHIHMAWADNVAYSASQYVEVAMFHVAGLLVGVLADGQRRLTLQYRNAATSLDLANRELRQSHDQLRRAERLSALGEIAAGLAHELRNPLAGVKGALEILTSRAQPGTLEAEFAELGTKELLRLDGLLTDFLTYARPRAPELREAELRPIIEHVVALLRPDAARAQVSIVAEFAPASGVLIDAEQMEQVLFNVLLNAVQASPRGSSVRLREDQDGHRVVIDIVDEGPGIPDELLPRIFDPFVTTKRRGTGLGLAVSSRIVAAHGGTIEAKRAEPRGTRMRIGLPLGAPTQPVVQRPAMPAGSPARPVQSARPAVALAEGGQVRQSSRR
jgi:two-component system, NtrC family, sensor histidine kinase HydH